MQSTVTIPGIELALCIHSITIIKYKEYSFKGEVCDTRCEKVLMKFPGPFYRLSQEKNLPLYQMCSTYYLLFPEPLHFPNKGISICLWIYI